MQNPIPVYNATSILEARHLVDRLSDVGIEAHVLEDLSLAGLGMIGGSMLNNYSPKLMVGERDVEAAVSVLREYDRDREARAAYERATGETGYTLPALCVECGKTALYREAERGTVQKCPFCRAHVDVGDEEDEGDWGEPED
jgi:hypothetical protein